MTLIIAYRMRARRRSYALHSHCELRRGFGVEVNLLARENSKRLTYLYLYSWLLLYAAVACVVVVVVTKAAAVAAPSQIEVSERLAHARHSRLPSNSPELRGRENDNVSDGDNDHENDGDDKRKEASRQLT